MTERGHFRLVLIVGICPLPHGRGSVFAIVKGAVLFSGPRSTVARITRLRRVPLLEFASMDSAVVLVKLLDSVLGLGRDATALFHW